MPTAVRDVMTTDVVRFTRDENITDAMHRLVDAGVSGGPVVDGDGRVVGMLTDSDLIVQDAQLHAPTAIAILGTVISLPRAQREFEEELHKQVGMTVGEVMEDDPVTIDGGCGRGGRRDGDARQGHLPAPSDRCRSTPRRHHRSWRHPAVHGGRARRELTSVRPTVADIDLGAIRDNVTLLRRIASPAALCAVVKADGYGHGATEAAVAALEGGATQSRRRARRGGDRSPGGRDHRPHPRALTTSARRDGHRARERPRAHRLHEGRHPGSAARGAPGSGHAGLATPPEGRHGDASGRLRAGGRSSRSRRRSTAARSWCSGACGPTAPSRTTSTTRSPRSSYGGSRMSCATSEPSRCRFRSRTSRTRREPSRIPTTRMDLVRCGIAIYGLAPSPAVASLVAAPGLRPAMRLRPRSRS